MPVTTIKRSHLTIPEVAERWSMSLDDIRHAISEGKLVPSYVIDHVASKVRFYQATSNGQPEWYPVEFEQGEDGAFQLTSTSGYYYLVHPELGVGQDCKFWYFSTNRDHVKGPEDENICFMLTPGKPTRWGRGISLDDVLENGVVTAKEIARNEVDTTSKPLESCDKTLSNRERDTLLAIIGLLCDKARVDHTRSAQAAGILKNVADTSGIDIGESTIEGHLQKVAEALNRKLIK